MLEVKNLVKRYGNHVAVDNLSFSVGPRQIFGFLGPNGAGKSTTMNIITGTLSASEGSITVNGYDIFHQSKQARRCIGYLPELPPVYMELTPAEYLAFVAEAKGIEKNLRKIKIAEAMEKTKIVEMKDRLIGNLSKGYRQRVGLAQAILGDPQLLILDEPMVGLDPQQIIDVRELICDMGKRSTVILSSHILSEISMVCDQLMIIRKGKFVAQGTPEQLEKGLSGDKRCCVTIASADLQKAETIINGLGANVYEQRFSTDRSTVELMLRSSDSDSLRSNVSAALFKGNCPVLGMEDTKVSLEEIFLELTNQDMSQENADEERTP